MSAIIENHIKKIQENFFTHDLSCIDFSSLSDLDEFLIRFQPYSYQVNNGGHQQYIYNQCHTSIKTNKNFSDTKDLHELLIKSAENLSFDNDSFNTFISILKDFEIEIDLEEGDDEICSECNGSGEILNDDYDEDHDDEDCRYSHCDYCDGHGEHFVENENFHDLKNLHHLEKLDSRYYEIFNDLVSFIETKIPKHVF